MKTQRQQYIPDLAACLVLLVVTFCVFRPSLKADFVKWDDDINIYRNPHIQKLDGAHLRWMFTDYRYMRRYVPLIWLSSAITYEMGNGHPFPFFLENLIFHLANTLMVYWIVRILLARGIQDRARIGPLAFSGCATVAALFWAIHPLRVEIVSWASGRLYLQSAFLALLSLTAYLRAVVDEPRPAFKTPWFWVSVAAYGASLLSYPITIGFVAVFLVIDVYPLRRAFRAALLEKLPFLALSAAVVLVSIWARNNVTGFWKPPPTLEQFGVLSRCMQAFYMWACYVWKPWLQTDFFPAYTTLVDFNPTAWPFLASVVLVVGITVIAFISRRRFPVLLAVWICHLALLFPVLGLSEHPHYPADRYSYVEGICWSVVIGAGLLLLLRKSGRYQAIVLILAAAVAGWFGWRAYRQTFVWNNSVSLFRQILDHLEQDRYKADIYWRLGSYYADRGDTAQALQQYSDALSITPSFFPALKQRGLLRLATGAVADALVDLEKAHAIQPDATVSQGLGVACALRGQPDLARQYFNEAIGLDPNDAATYHHFAVLLTRQGKLAEAVEYLQKALQLDPENQDAKLLLDRITARLRQLPANGS